MNVSQSVINVQVSQIYNFEYFRIVIFSLTFIFYFTDASINSTLYTSVKKYFNDKSFVEFLCSLCNYKSYNATNIKRHVRLHTGERPFRCNICYKDFNEKGHLKKHLAIHSKCL